MKSNEDRLEDTKHEIKKKLEKLHRRLQNMKTLDENQTSTIKELEKPDTAKIGKVLIETKRADISQKQEDLAQTEKDWEALKKTCDGQQLSIKGEEDHISRAKTRISTDTQILAGYRLRIIEIESKNVELETQIIKMNG